MKLVERFLSYVAVDTQSDEYSNTVPSTEKQKNLARLLKKELEDMGLQEVYLDVHCVVNSKTISNRTTRTINVKTDIFIWILALKIQKLCNNQASSCTIHFFIKHNNSVVEQTGKNIV